MIVKLQRPLASNEPISTVLIYNQDRTHQWVVPWSLDDLNELLGSDPKGYFELEVDENDNFVLGGRVEDQPW